MKVDKFQDKAKKTARYTKGSTPGLVPTIWVCEESSEVLKEYRQALSRDMPLNEQNVREEIGDVLIALAHLCNEMGYDLNDIMKEAVDKQQKRFDDSTEQQT